MTTPYYKLTATHLKSKINPVNLPGYFQIGNQPGQIAEAVVNETLEDMEARVVSSLPDRYAVKHYRWEGLVVVRYAFEGQATFTLPTAPTGDLQIFKNYPSNFGMGMRTFSRGDGSKVPYSARTADDALELTTDYSISTLTVTLVKPLKLGEHIVVDMDHGAMESCRELRLCVLEMSAAEILKSYPSNSTDVSDKVSSWEKNAYMFLKRLSGEDGYRTGVQFLDKLKFVPETETRQGGAVRPVTPGMNMLL